MYRVFDVPGIRCIWHSICRVFDVPGIRSTGYSIYWIIQYIGYLPRALFTLYTLERVWNNVKRHLDVVSPSSNAKALSLLCNMDASKCTPEKWLDFLGNNPYAPFVINITLQRRPIQVRYHWSLNY